MGAQFDRSHHIAKDSTLHLHYHCCVTDGLFCAEEEGVRFHPSALCPEAMAEVEQRTRRRVLRLFKRHDLLFADVVEAMLKWSHAGGFSVDASVLIEASDRLGLERLLPTASECGWIVKCFLESISYYRSQ